MGVTHEGRHCRSPCTKKPVSHLPGPMLTKAKTIGTWSDETKIHIFGTDGVQIVWRRKGEEYNEKCMVPTVKHGGGSVLLWGCMSAAGVGELLFINGIMNSQMYCEILKEKMIPSLCALGHRALFQHDNDPKHTSKATGSERTE